MTKYPFTLCAIRDFGSHYPEHLNSTVDLLFTLPSHHPASYLSRSKLCTRYDIPSAVPDGSIQRAGENVLALLREVANSAQLANPQEDEKHGKVVFFDILGLMTIVYPESVAIAINYSVVVIVFITVYFGVRSTKDSKNNGMMNLYLQLMYNYFGHT